VTVRNSILRGDVGGWVVRFTGNALSSVVAFIAVPLFVIYFLIDEPKITRQIRDQLPRAWAGDALAFVHIFNRIFGSYTRGVIIESIIVGIITGLGYFIIGVNVWLPLGVWMAGRRAAPSLPDAAPAGLALPVGDVTAFPSPRPGCSTPAPPDEPGMWERAVRAYSRCAGMRVEPWGGSIVNTAEKCRALAAEFPQNANYKSRLAALLQLQAQHFGQPKSEQQ